MRDRINIFIRHDVDTLFCIQNLSILLDIDKQYGIKPGIFFRVDDNEYSVLEHKNFILSCRDQGFETGLHTLCYLHDDYINMFKKETEKFTDIIGFSPQSFTIHGLGNYRINERTHFSEEIIGQMEEFGYNFTDCNIKMRTYDYVIEDCHWDESKKTRFIYNDFIKLPPTAFRSGNTLLILTHPCYWK